MRVLIVFLAASVLIFADDWPQFRGINRDGISVETGIAKDWKSNPPKELWRFPLSDDGYAGPSMAGGIVYIIDRDGSGDALRAIDASGKEIWKYTYAEAGGFNYGFSRSTPAVNNGKVYGLSRNGHLYCVDANTGAPVWTVNLVSKFGGVLPKWLYAVSPFIDGDNLIVIPGGGKNPIALNKDTGEAVWQGDVAEGVSYATPVIGTFGGVKQYILFMAKSLTGVSAENGSLLWRIPWETSYDVNAALPVIIDDRIFITSGYKHGCAMVKADAKSASILWENKNVQAHFSSPVYLNGHIFASSDPGDLVCLDLDGNVKWRKGVIEKGGFIVIDGVIILQHGKTGEVVMAEVNPAAYVELGKFRPFPGGKPDGARGWQFWAAPIVADGKLVVRSQRELACFDLK